MRNCRCLVNLIFSIIILSCGYSAFAEDSQQLDLNKVVLVQKTTPISGDGTKKTTTCEIELGTLAKHLNQPPTEVSKEIAELSNTSQYSPLDFWVEPDPNVRLEGIAPEPGDGKCSNFLIKEESGQGSVLVHDLADKYFDAAREICQ